MGQMTNWRIILEVTCPSNWQEPDVRRWVGKILTPPESQTVMVENLDDSRPRKMPKPLCIDLFCGLGGWAEGFLSEGWDVIGFDIENHDYGTGGYPGQLVIQDVLTLHGSQFRQADCIVASPPCQAYSYMAMPWNRAKTEIAWQKWFRDSGSPFADPFTLNDLFNACFRIQREAS